MKWFKFYGQDWLTDLKIISMPIEDRLCFITLLSLASIANENGVIRNCDEHTVIKLTHLSDDPTNDDNEYSRAVGFLKRFEALQIVTLVRNADVTHEQYSVTLCNFGRRQDKNLSNAERQKNYRKRLKTTTKERNASNVTQRNDSNARIDKIRIDKNREDKSIVISNAGIATKDVVEIIKSFEIVNPFIGEKYGNRTERKAAESIVKSFGFEKAKEYISYLPKTNAIQFAPKITTPYEFVKNFGKLKAHLEQERSKKQKNIAISV